MASNADIHENGPTQPKRVVVVGGANTDIAGIAYAPLIARDSNPGRVRISPGGVARNIAENLARLGADVELVTGFGGDHNAVALADACRAEGIKVDRSVWAQDLPGSVYLAIMDDDGQMQLALNDMRSLDRLTPDVLAEREGAFAAADLIVADTNIPAESLDWLAENSRAPIVMDAVSVAKASRAEGALQRLHTLKASGLEAGALLGIEVRNRDQAEEAARALVLRGPNRVFVTSGAFGVAWADAAGSGRMAAPIVAEVANATGAGDAFAAGIAYATLEEWPMQQAAAFASACAALALESEDTVSDQMDLERASKRAAAALAEARE